MIRLIVRAPQFQTSSLRTWLTKFCRYEGMTMIKRIKISAEPGGLTHGNMICQPRLFFADEPTLFSPLDLCSKDKLDPRNTMNSKYLYYSTTYFPMNLKNYIMVLYLTLLGQTFTAFSRWTSPGNSVPISVQPDSIFESPADEMSDLRKLNNHNEIVASIFPTVSQLNSKVVFTKFSSARRYRGMWTHSAGSFQSNYDVSYHN